MKTEEEAKNITTTTVVAENSAEGDDIADGGGGGRLKEEEKIKEDAIVESLAEAQPNNRDEERADAHALGDTNESVQQNNNGDAASSSQKGTVVEIPDENNISAREDAAVLDDGGEDRGRVTVTPGFMFVPGPDYGTLAGEYSLATNLGQMMSPILLRLTSLYKDFFQKMIRHVGERSQITRF